jgi:hypothetical protein
VVKVDSRKNAVSVTLMGCKVVYIKGQIRLKKQQPDELQDAANETITEAPAVATKPPKAVEYGGQKGPEPTRFGDWEKAGRCTDF